MAEYDYVNPTSYDYWGDGGVLSTGTDKHFVWNRRINMATAGDTLTTAGVFAAADIINIFDVAEGMCIQYAAIEVITAEGATCTCDLGDGADANGYLKLVNLNSAGWYQPDGTYGSKYLGLDTPTHGMGKTYTSADTIDITCTHADTDVAVFDVWIAGVYFSPIYVA